MPPPQVALHTDQLVQVVGGGRGGTLGAGAGQGGVSRHLLLASAPALLVLICSPRPQEALHWDQLDQVGGGAAVGGAAEGGADVGGAAGGGVTLARGQAGLQYPHSPWPATCSPLGVVLVEHQARPVSSNCVVQPVNLLFLKVKGNTHGLPVSALQLSPLSPAMARCSQASCSATLVYTPGLPPRRPHSGSPKEMTPSSTSRPLKLVAVRPPPLSPLQESATSCAAPPEVTSRVPRAQIWFPFSWGQKDLQSVLSMMLTRAVCTMFGNTVEPELVAISPNPVTSTVVSSRSRYRSLTGSGRQMGTTRLL